MCSRRTSVHECKDSLIVHGLEMSTTWTIRVLVILLGVMANCRRPLWRGSPSNIHTPNLVLSTLRTKRQNVRHMPKSNGIVFTHWTELCSYHLSPHHEHPNMCIPVRDLYLFHLLYLEALKSASFSPSHRYLKRMFSFKKRESKHEPRSERSQSIKHCLPNSTIALLEGNFRLAELETSLKIDDLRNINNSQPSPSWTVPT